MPPLHRAAACLSLLLGAMLLALAAGGVVMLGYLWWSGPPAADGRLAPGNDSYALGAVAGVVVDTLALGLGYALWSVGWRIRERRVGCGRWSSRLNSTGCGRTNRCS
ncbi:hypothetical protein J421_5306 (plasmid) [Gemmatirosa kalamazoonensis]|uniref:Uncharacterized protein n=1 Tax=Gemmatirosa kalamazoonensis TaxID=861299 RepID=W0RQ58_9BACT|nr:hypothetical protein [Gemmatirosa kalamazoonensis]AHG92841.1 hypothetical protein J421_5306 [Gemmatirosa kalamazoonensis]